MTLYGASEPHGTHQDHDTHRGATESSMLTQLRAMYREMPGMVLTIPQACRLMHSDDSIIRSSFETLVAQGFLRQVRPGRYALAE